MKEIVDTLLGRTSNPVLIQKCKKIIDLYQTFFLSKVIEKVISSRILGHILDNSVKLYYTAWRKVIRKAWCLPFTTHCRFLHTINNSLPIDVQLEKRCLKFLHSCLNSSNEVVKSISLSSIQQSFPTFGENYRYLCHKYKIMPYMFRSDFPIIIKQIHLYVDDHHGPHHEAVMVRELCIAIDENRFTVFTAEEMCHLVEYLCTI